MRLEPIDWNVVILGRWNLAILTPNRIATRIFNVEEGKPVGVAVPLDGVSPYQVRSPDGKIVVVAENERLIIKVAQLDYESLGEAMAAGIRVLEWLPETPVSAVGFNVRFRTQESVPEILDILSNPVDNSFSDMGLAIAKRTLARSMAYEKGELNITIEAGEKNVGILFNFHRGSQVRDDLKKWLQIPTQNIKVKVRGLLHALKIEIEENTNGKNGM